MTVDDAAGPRGDEQPITTPETSAMIAAQTDSCHPEQRGGVSAIGNPGPVPCGRPRDAIAVKLHRTLFFILTSRLLYDAFRLDRQIRRQRKWQPCFECFRDEPPFYLRHLDPFLVN